MKKLFIQVFIISMAICTTLSLFCPYGYAARYEPRVIIDSESVNKRVIYQSFICGGVRNILTGNYRSSATPELTIIGLSDIHFLTADNYKPLYNYSFKDSYGKSMSLGVQPDIIDIDNDGNYKIIRPGGGFGDIGLLDKRGNKIWTFRPNKDIPPKKMVYGDLDKDNETEFYALDYRELYRLDEKGNVIWKIDKIESGLGRKIFNYIDIFTDEKSGEQLLLINSEKDFTVIDSKGNIINKFKVDYKPNTFEIVEWNNRQYILCGYFSKKAVLLDLSGKKVYEFKLKKFPLYHGPNAVSVKFKPDEKEYLVLLAHSRSSIQLTQINIISPEGEIIYQEVINKSFGLAPLYKKERNSEVLIIGNGTKEILEYSLE